MAGLAADLPRARMPAAALRVLGDDRLARLAAAGDSRAFETIYERHHQPLYRYCRSIVGNGEDAADALQSTMASAFRALAGEGRDIALKPWLFRIAHNECMSLLRKRRPHAAIDDALELEAPLHDPAVRQRLQELMADLRELPDAQRGALVMHEMSGFRYREIAETLETTEPHARQLVYEARAALHELAEGRAMECDGVRRAISDSDRRILRGRRISAHLRSCADCQSFDRLIGSRRRDLAALAPPLPAAMAAAVLHKALGGGSSSAAAASSAGSGGGLGSVVAGKVAAGSVVAKAVAVVAVTAAAGAGAVEVAHVSKTQPAADHAPAASHAAVAPKRPAPTRVAASRPVVGGGNAMRNAPAPKHAARKSHNRTQPLAAHIPAQTPANGPLHPSRPPHHVTKHSGAPLISKPQRPAKPQHPTHLAKPKTNAGPHPRHTPVKPVPKPKPVTSPQGRQQAHEGGATPVAGKKSGAQGEAAGGAGGPQG